MRQQGPYAKIGCSGGTLPSMYGNSVGVPDPTKPIAECGMDLAQWQALGHDNGTTVGPWPAAADLIATARRLLAMQ